MDSKKIVIVRHYNGTALVCINKTKSEALAQFTSMYGYAPSASFVTEEFTHDDTFVIP